MKRWVTDILTEQNFTCNDNALVINDLQERIQEFLIGGGLLLPATPSLFPTTDKPQPNLQEWIQEFLLGEGEGKGEVTPNFDSENTTVTFLCKLLLLETLSLSPKTNKSQPNSPPLQR